MALISSEESSGDEQNVQGPRPSFTQMILPHSRQFGAAARRGWRVARQLQRRSGGEAEREGLVWSSSVRIAESLAEISVRDLRKGGSEGGRLNLGALWMRRASQGHRKG